MLSGGSIDDFESRARRVKDDAALRDRLVLNDAASREPYPLSPHIEERIYNGFPGPNDEARMAAFHKASWPDRLAIVQSFEDERLRWFGLRLIYVEARALLPETVRLPYLRAGFGRDGQVAVGGGRRGWPSGSVPPLSPGAERASSRVPGSAGRLSLSAA